LQERDPFYEPPESEVLIGGVHAYLRSLAYMVESDEQLPVTDFKGQERGQLSVGLYPCTPQGKEITGEFVDSPQDLVGKNLSFKVKIHSAVGLPNKFVMVIYIRHNILNVYV
jgi:kinesin family protein 1